MQMKIHCPAEYLRFVLGTENLTTGAPLASGDLMCLSFAFLVVVRPGVRHNRVSSERACMRFPQLLLTSIP
jgi:hypothetical protein